MLRESSTSHGTPCPSSPSSPSARLPAMARWPSQAAVRLPSSHVMANYTRYEASRCLVDDGIDVGRTKCSDQYPWPIILVCHAIYSSPPSRILSRTGYQQTAAVNNSSATRFARRERIPLQAGRFADSCYPTFPEPVLDGPHPFSGRCTPRFRGNVLSVRSSLQPSYICTPGYRAVTANRPI